MLSEGKCEKADISYVTFEARKKGKGRERDKNRDTYLYKMKHGNDKPENNIDGYLQQ